MDIPSKYDPQRVEKQWYTYWMEHEYFRSVPDEREPYTVVIPPPNVTGVLHMGHMLNNTIQDVLVRRARMMGKNACWVPGTDHASIATEAKVVAKLRDEGISKDSISREEFLKHAWDWTHNYGGVILEQLKKLGCSCDWERTKFTMDPDMEASVLQVFVDLYKKGLIYRGYRMVNWDPEARTTLSDEEVNYEERQGFLYHIAYPVVGSESRVVIATTRPETLLGDTAVCVHPEDERYLDLHGKRVRVPICDREVPVIPDEYVTMEFGTGCLKVTPAHDENDYALGEKHGLEIVDIFNPDATLNAHGLHYQGMDRFEARKAIVKELEAKGYLVKTEPYTNKVGTSERTRAVIEPRLSDQWFLRMEELAQPALKAVLETRDVRLVPSKFENTYRHWMENIRDWNISRQLWWGQRIPAWYYGPGQADFVVAATPAEALEQARQGRRYILRKMLEAVPRPNQEIAEHAPRFEKVKIPGEKIGFLIGPGGRTIKARQDEYKVRVSVLDDEGNIQVFGPDSARVKACADAIEAMCETPKIGTRYTGTVKSIKDFGAFIEILPGVEGMCHISELDEGYVERVSDVVSTGDEIEVVVINVDDRGKIKLSRKAALVGSN